jgi:hypothetical protein
MTGTVPPPRFRVSSASWSGSSYTVISVTDNPVRWWAGRETVLISAGAGVVLVCRVLGVSRGNSTTAILLLSEADTSTTLLGLVVYLSRLAPVIWCTLALSVMFVASEAGDRSTARSWGLRYLAGLGVAVVLTPLSDILGILVFGGLIGLLSWLLSSDPGKRRTSLRWLARVTVPLFVTGIGLVALFNPRPWLPAERIAPRHGPALTGYVLNESPDTVVVLRDDNRAVVRLDPATISSRAFCALEAPRTGDHRQSLLTLVLNDEAAYPMCPGHS